MKTQARNILALAIGGLVTLLCLTTNASATDKDYERDQRQRLKDFETYLKSRTKSEAAEMKATEALRLERKKTAQKQQALELEFQKKSKPYSMEEVEARDRADEARVVKELKRNEADRETFVVGRNRRRSIKSKVGDVDTYREFDIEMKREPESKVSHSSSSSGSANAEE